MQPVSTSYCVLWSGQGGRKSTVGLEDSIFICAAPKATLCPAYMTEYPPHSEKHTALELAPTQLAPLHFSICVQISPFHDTLRSSVSLAFTKSVEIHYIRRIAATVCVIIGIRARAVRTPSVLGIASPTVVALLKRNVFCRRRSCFNMQHNQHRSEETS